jgi:general L-amino acid transport system substrate-binding protein
MLDPKITMPQSILRHLQLPQNLLSFFLAIGCFGIGTSINVPALANSPLDRQSNISQTTQSRLDTVIARGHLLCGVEGSIPDFSFVDAEGRYSGLDVDICRAVAAAIFGDASRVEYRNLSSADRFPALRNGEVDLLSRNSTWTASRDATNGNGFDFAPPIFYDGQGVMVRRNSGMTRLQDLQGKTVCVEAGTTTELIMERTAQEAGLVLKLVRLQSGREAFETYLDQKCDAVTSDRSFLSAIRTSAPNPNEHLVWDTVLSREPLAPITLDNDAQWSDVVAWTIYGLLQAEELGITQANVQSKLSSSDFEVKLFLGVTGDIGSKFGLSNDFMVKVIRAVGNYGEVYDRNVGSRSLLNIPRSINNLWNRGGLMYAPAWR